jgi:hypothetical protein
MRVARRAGTYKTKVLADRILSRPESPRDGLTDDHHEPSAVTISIGECASTHERNAANDGIGGTALAHREPVIRAERILEPRRRDSDDDVLSRVIRIR